MHLPVELIAHYKGHVWRSPNPHQLVRLAWLLESCFTHEQLVRFFEQHRDGSIAAELPRGTGLTGLCWHAVVELRRRGWIDERMFAHLLLERPGRERDIDEVVWCDR